MGSAMVARTDKSKAKGVSTRRGLGEVVAQVVGQVVAPQVPACIHDEHLLRLARSVLPTLVLADAVHQAASGKFCFIKSGLHAHERFSRPPSSIYIDYTAHTVAEAHGPTALVGLRRPARADCSSIVIPCAPPYQSKPRRVRRGQGRSA